MKNEVTDNWNGLEQVLKNCAPNLSILECKYLKNAFFRTEQLWCENFAQVKKVRLVMLSEAPLFGDDERYFYNPTTRFGAFFHFNDAEAILGEGFGNGMNFNCLEEKKQFLLRELAKAGFVVLDLFPFALNKSDTSISYTNLTTREYQRLFREAIPMYFRRKLDLFLERDSPKFVFRYRRLQRNIGELELAGLKMAPAHSVHGKNMSLNREMLRSCFQDM
jgi:hypothetical protein